MKTLRQKMEALLARELVGRTWQHPDDKRIRPGTVTRIELTYDSDTERDSGGVRVQAQISTGRSVEVELDSPDLRRWGFGPRPRVQKKL